MLGLMWVEFDMKKSTLSAEGNGYMVKSEYMPGLGIVTRISRLSKPTHEENRMIPCHEIKRFVSGRCLPYLTRRSIISNLVRKNWFLAWHV